jgi:hypothetical protein
MPKDAPLAVEVPAPDRDKPGWVKVGVIAAAGFIIGIAWPRLVGVRLGPAAPGESAAAAASASAAASAHGRAPDAPPASVTVKSPAAASAVASAAVAPSPTVAAPAVASAGGAPPNITVQKGSVISCKTGDGETKKGKECGAVPGIDQIVKPRVRKIATCSGVEGQTGKLSLIVNADFASGRFWYDVGKSSTLPNIDAVTSCLKTSFHNTSTTATPHEHSRYTVSYTAVFAPGSSSGALDDDKAASTKVEPSERSAKEAPDEKSERPEKPARPEKSDLASGEAAVAWEVALVRDTPKTGGLLARLPRGTKVKVGSAKDGWYQIKFGDGFANEGWVYRGAIGR